jgi:hypothetical protein
MLEANIRTRTNDFFLERLLISGYSTLVSGISAMRQKGVRAMPFTEQQVHDELKKHGITTMSELARKIAEESASKAKSGIAAPDYLWSGKNYSLYHPETTTHPK